MTPIAQWFLVSIGPNGNQAIEPNDAVFNEPPLSFGSYGKDLSLAENNLPFAPPEKLKVLIEALLNGIDEVRDTILHEIAHALCPKDGHGPRWRATCRRIGARPARCYTEASVISPPRAPAPYRFGCPRCGWWVERRKRSRRAYLCKLCRGKVTYQLALIPPEASLQETVRTS